MAARPTRENYSRVREEKPRQQSNDNEIRVMVSHRQHAYIAYAMAVLNGEDGKSKNDTIRISGMGAAIFNAVNIAEIVKHRIAGLHQITEIGSELLRDVYEPNDRSKNPDNMTIERRVSTIVITLSREPLDSKNPGYQQPIPADQVTEQPTRTYSSERRGRRRGGEGGAGGRNNRRGSSGDRAAAGEEHNGERRGDRNNRNNNSDNNRQEGGDFRGGNRGRGNRRGNGGNRNNNDANNNNHQQEGNGHRDGSRGGNNNNSNGNNRRGGRGPMRGRGCNDRREDNHGGERQFERRGGDRRDDRRDDRRN